MTSNPLQELENALIKGGLRAGLIFLNNRVTHRCTVVYRLDNNILSLVELVDKLNDKSSFGLPEIPLADSFCEMVIGNGSLSVTNSKKDCRLSDHLHKSAVISYVGLPLMQSPGDLFGTFCHYDFCEQTLPDEEYLFLQDVARLLPKFI